MDAVKITEKLISVICGKLDNIKECISKNK